MNLLESRDAARLLGIAPSTLGAWRRQGRGPAFIRVGPRAVRYAVTDLVEFLRRGRVGRDSSAGARADEGGTPS